MLSAKIVDSGNLSQRVSCEILESLKLAWSHESISSMSETVFYVYSVSGVYKYSTMWSSNKSFSCS